MFKITLVTVGHLKEEYWKEAQKEYIRRLKPYAKISLVEINAESFGKSVTAKQAMEREGERLQKYLSTDALVIALERTGKTYSSHQFATLLNTESVGGREILFILGGTAGLDEKLLAQISTKISFSPMTFTHEMARIILLEQLYRAVTILIGKPYHY